MGTPEDLRRESGARQCCFSGTCWECLADQSSRMGVLYTPELLEALALYSASSNDIQGGE